MYSDYFLYQILSTLQVLNGSMAGSLPSSAGKVTRTGTSTALDIPCTSNSHRTIQLRNAGFSWGTKQFYLPKLTTTPPRHQQQRPRRQQRQRLQRQQWQRLPGVSGSDRFDLQAKDVTFQVVLIDVSVFTFSCNPKSVVTEYFSQSQRPELTKTVYFYLDASCMSIETTDWLFGIGEKSHCLHGQQ